MSELVRVFSLVMQLVVLRHFLYIHIFFFQFHAWLPLEMSIKSTKQRNAALSKNTRPKQISQRLKKINTLL